MKSNDEEKETKTRGADNLTTSKTNDEISPLGIVLTKGRRVLWQSSPRMFGWFLGPMRVFMLDPALAISSVLLPVLLPRPMDQFVALSFEMLGLPVLRVLYDVQEPTNNEVGLNDAANKAILRPTMVMIHPPSNAQSAFQGAISFLCSAIGDVAGLFAHPKKYTGWMNALSQFNTFLESTGVADEMVEAIQTPLLQGRLMENFKILNDIQAQHHSNRVALAQPDNVMVERTKPSLDEEIRRGHRFMRFATAAYGTEMIRSAVDREVDASDFFLGPAHSIAVHTRLHQDDIRFIYAGHENDSEKEILPHFIAVDHQQECVVLAIRGTLNLSSTIVDMQGMAAEFCSGQAHKGIAEMASNLWNESGTRIMELMEEFKTYNLIITGHSLGAGTSCLLTLKLYVDKCFDGERKIECFAFAPPPTFSNCHNDSPCSASIQKAKENTVAFIHDNDVVPFLSVSAVRRMIHLLDVVDNQTEHMWFWKRWKIFYNYAPIPSSLVLQVIQAERALSEDQAKRVEGECPMVIPARRVVWCKQDFQGQFQAFSCDPEKVAATNIFLSPDMLSDHLPEQYEDALDSLFEQNQDPK